MFGFLLFLHLTGLMVWLGALLAVVVILPMLYKQSAASTAHANPLACRIIRVFGMLAHPAAAIVLLSGVTMIIDMDLGQDKPLWLEIMEKGGGTVVLLSLAWTGILGRKARKRLIAAAGQAVTLSGYRTASACMMVLIVSIVLVVSLKI